LTEYNLEKLFYDLLKKKNIDKEISYTSTLLTNKNVLAKKIGEETIEVILEYLGNNKDKIIQESADLLYHLIVMWISSNVNPSEVWQELQKRKGISGFEEKKSRTN
tara:strand:- start:388 stop:705 length:318 start_codon:yes stop_codon:yes gene_type:complete